MTDFSRSKEERMKERRAYGRRCARALARSLASKAPIRKHGRQARTSS